MVNLVDFNKQGMDDVMADEFKVGIGEQASWPSSSNLSQR